MNKIQQNRVIISAFLIPLLFKNLRQLCLRWVNFKLSLVGQFYIAGDEHPF